MIVFSGRAPLDDATHAQAMEAFCRQRARMEGEDEQFWLAEATAWRMHAVAHTPADRFKATLVPRIHPDREQGSALF